MEVKVKGISPPLPELRKQHSFVEKRKQNSFDASICNLGMKLSDIKQEVKESDYTLKSKRSIISLDKKSLQSYLEQSEKIQFTDMQMVHEDFTTFRQNSFRQNSHRDSVKLRISHNRSKTDITQSLRNSESLRESLNLYNIQNP